MTRTSGLAAGRVHVANRTNAAGQSARSDGSVASPFLETLRSRPLSSGFGEDGRRFAITKHATCVRGCSDVIDKAVRIVRCNLSK
eukprot:5667037-Prymnesium_polylepis.1